MQNLDWLSIKIGFELKTNPEITEPMFKICLALLKTEIFGQFFNLFNDPFQYETPCTTPRSITLAVAITIDIRMANVVAYHNKLLTQ